MSASPIYTCRQQVQPNRLWRSRYLHRPKHIEVQILSDQYGNHVHLFERDCSLQRKHQKVIEIAPSSGLSQELRAAMFKAAIDLAKFVKYGKECAQGRGA